MIPIPFPSRSQISFWTPSIPWGNDTGKKIANLGKDSFEYIWKNKPARVLGYRFQCQKTPVTPYSTLHKIREKIQEFEERKRSLAHFGNHPAKLDKNNNSLEEIPVAAPLQLLPAPEELPHARAPRPPQEVPGKEAFTDLQVKLNAENFSAYAILSYMHSSICHIKESDDSHLNSLIGEARQKKLSLWKLFMRDYGKEVSWFQWVECALAYFFYSLVVPLTAWVYCNRPIVEIRSFFREKGKERSDPKKLARFNQTLIRIAARFSEAYRRADRNYVRANPQTGSPEDYLAAEITNAVGKTLDELYFESSQSVATHFSPEVPFHWLVKKPLNWGINWVMKKKVLPLVSQAAGRGWIRSTDRSNVSFFLALTQTLRAQLEKLEKNRKEGSNGESPSPPPPGTEELTSTIKKLIVVIELSTSKKSGPGAIKKTLEEIEEKEAQELLDEKQLSNDAKISKGLEGSISKATHVLFDYLADPKNREDLLGQFSELLNTPFSNTLPKDEEAWERKVAEYENSLEDLKNSALRIFWDLSHGAVKAALPGGIDPAIMKKSAKKAFQGEKIHLQKLFHQISLFSQQIKQKIHRESPNEQNNLFPHLIAIAELLKGVDTENQLKKELEPLDDAGRNGILHVLNPLFEKADELSEQLLKLQETQEQHLYHRRATDDFRQISENLLRMSKNKTTDPKEFLEAIDKILSGMQPLLDDPKRKNPIPLLKSNLQEIQQISTSLFSHRRALDALYALAPLEEGQQQTGLLRDLARSVRKESLPRKFSKKKCLKQINEKIEALVPDPNVRKESFLTASKAKALLREERKELIRLIEKLNQFSPDLSSFNEEVWQPLVDCLSRHRQNRCKEIEVHETRLNQILPVFENYIKKYGDVYAQRRKDNFIDLQKKSTSFHEQIVAFQEKAKNLKQEPQIEIGQDRLQDHLAVVGAFSTAAIGFAARFATSIFLPAYKTLGQVGASAFAGFYASQQASDTVNDVEKIYDQKEGGFLKNALTLGSLSRTTKAAFVAAAETTAVWGLQHFEAHPFITTTVTYGLLASSPYLGSRLGRVVHALEKGVEVGTNQVYPKVKKILEGAFELILAPENYRGLFRLAMKEFIAAYPPEK